MYYAHPRTALTASLFILTGLVGRIASAQSPGTDKLPSFEVASIRVVDPSRQLPANWQQMAVGRKGGRYFRPSITLQVCLQIAFQLPAYRIQAPAWANSQRYDIVATMPPDTSDDEVLQMFQRLLVERFQLQFHWEERVLDSFALVLDKRGPKLTKAAAGAESTVSIRPFGFSAKNKSMQDLASILMRWTDRPVLDMTGVTGQYDFNLDWRADSGIGGDATSSTGSGKALPDSFSVLAALPSLGIRAVGQKAPIKFLIVDSAERIPAEN